MNTSKLKIILVAAVVTAFAAAPLTAHHSVSAGFDSTKPTTIKGVITRIEWTNPHVWIFMNVKSADGKTVAWRVEMASPVALMQAGFEKGFLNLTSSFTVEVWPARTESPEGRLGNGRLLTLQDGRTFDISDKWGMFPLGIPGGK